VGFFVKRLAKAHPSAETARYPGVAPAPLMLYAPTMPERGPVREAPALTSRAEPRESLLTWTHVVYGLHAVSLITGIIGAATVVGAFLTGWPSIIAVILNYVKRGDARGTWLESHFRWQIRTFWFGLLWVVLCVLFVVATLGIGMLIAWVPLGVVGIWFIYRVARGWLQLKDRRPMYE
jgi:uncharacterized membrane protein